MVKMSESVHISVHAASRSWGFLLMITAMSPIFASVPGLSTVYELSQQNSAHPPKRQGPCTTPMGALAPSVMSTVGVHMPPKRGCFACPMTLLETTSPGSPVTCPACRVMPSRQQSAQAQQHTHLPQHPSRSIVITGGTARLGCGGMKPPGVGRNSKKRLWSGLQQQRLQKSLISSATRTGGPSAPRSIAIPGWMVYWLALSMMPQVIASRKLTF
mmetsp:Transcript_17319/g.55570  ORF Transcript_17319/g.55570 Transcript_17319/m.55570 type:complete len:215 (+) Transcript_17319:435-1079(+)